MTQKSHVLWCVLTVVGLVLGVGAVSVLGLNPSPPAKELVSLRWTQSHSCREGCFAFFVERQDGIPCLSGEYVQKEERNPEDLPLSEPQWRQLETYLTTHTFPPRSEPTPDLLVLDATESCLTITWRQGGRTVTEEWDGQGARELRRLLADLAEDAWGRQIEGAVSFSRDSTT